MSVFDRFKDQSIVVTGGAGFIGSALVHALARAGARVTVIDKLTYAATTASLEPLLSNGHIRFETADIADGHAMRAIWANAQPEVVFHLAAETHVDRSIADASAFLRTNVIGTQVLIDTLRESGLADATEFRFVHVSTDEVFGALGPSGTFTDTSPYDPSSPYAASKAASDHLIRAAIRTHGFPALVTNCSNNYGPRQFPEKLIPLMILNAFSGKALPVYGKGEQVRDWIHVEDHVEALAYIALGGTPGDTFLIGTEGERRNIDVVTTLCQHLDARRPDRAPHTDLIAFVTDRPGHDWRYAISPSAKLTALGWRSNRTFEAGLAETVDWYLANDDWWRPLLEREAIVT